MTKILKLDLDKLATVTLLKTLNPWVRCAFGNVLQRCQKKKTWYLLITLFLLATSDFLVLKGFPQLAKILLPQLCPQLDTAHPLFQLLFLKPGSLLCTSLHFPPIFRTFAELLVFFLPVFPLAVLAAPVLCQTLAAPRTRLD